MSYSHRLLPHLALVAILTASLTVEAAEWSADPSVKVRGEFNDNIRLTSVEHDNVWGAILDPSLKLSRRSELWELDARGRLRAADYAGEDGLNTIDNFFDVAAKRHLERGSLDASASLINDTTLQSETLDLDTGLTIRQIDRMQRNLRLAGEYRFTEATWVELSAAHTRVEYDGGERFGLFDYDYLTPTARAVHQYTPKTQIFGVLSHARVDYDSNDDLESKTDSLQLGATYDITETWEVSASAGSRRTKTSSLVPTLVPLPGFEFLYTVQLLPRDSESSGLVYDTSLTREFETGKIKLSGTQSITPSSTGTDTDTILIRLEGDQQFSTKLSAGLAVSYYQSSSVGDVTTSADVDRYRISPSLTWKLDRDLALMAGYDYTRIKRATVANSTADSNAVYVSLGYSWPRMAVSR